MSRSNQTGRTAASVELKTLTDFAELDVACARGKSGPAKMIIRPSWPWFRKVSRRIFCDSGFPVGGSGEVCTKPEEESDGTGQKK